MIQVKNKIIERLDNTAKEYFYELLNDDVLICKAKEGIPDKGNVVKCGDGLIVSAPTSEQEPFCDGRVMPLYCYLPDMKDDAAYIAHLTEENALYFLDCMKEQYEPKEVYDFLMQGHTNGTLWNILEAVTINEFSDEENDRKIEIGEVYCKGEWKGYTCTAMGINERHTCGVSYEEHNLKAALKHFSKYLKGADKRAFDKFMQSEAEM